MDFKSFYIKDFLFDSETSGFLSFFQYYWFIADDDKDNGCSGGDEILGLENENLVRLGRLKRTFL